ARDRRLAQVHQAHVWLVVDLIIAALQRYAPGPEAMIGRAQLFGQLAVVHASANLAPREVGYGCVCGLVDQDVAEVSHPDAEPGFPVAPLVEGLALLGRDFERVAGVCIMNKAAVRLPTARENFGIAGLDPGLRFGIDCGVVQRGAPIRCALEYGEVQRGLGHLGDGLHARSTGADHGYALALKADRRVWPRGGVIGFTAEIADAWDGRHGRRRQRTDRRDQEA